MPTLPCSDPHGEFKGKNVLINLQPLTGDPQPKERLLADAREKLHAVRSKRPRPHLDDKVRRSLLTTGKLEPNVLIHWPESVRCSP